MTVGPMGAIVFSLIMHVLRRYSPLLLLATAIALLLVGAALLYSDARGRYTVDADGRLIPVKGRFETVSEALQDAKISPRPEDFVSPSLESPLPGDGTIVVRSAKPVELTLEGEIATVWTHQSNLASFLAENDIVLARSSEVRSDGLPVPLAALVETPLGASITVAAQREITVQDQQETLSLMTEADTVGQALIQAGVDMYQADRTTPALNTLLHPGLQITIERAAPVTVMIGDQVLTARTTRQDVAGVLAELGVGLIGRDQPFPGLDHSLSGAGLQDAESITVRRDSTAYELTESPLPYSSRFQPVAELEIDQRNLVSTGSPGGLARLIRVDPSASETVSQTVVGEWVSIPPVDEVVGYGTNIVVRSLDTPDGPISYWRVVRMRVTAYTAADAGKPPSHPAYGITASGRPAGYGIVAIDPDVVPFRSQVYVPGYGIAFAGDTGGGVRGRWIDLGYNEGEIQAWNGYVDVYYLTPVPAADRINYLIPATLP